MQTLRCSPCFGNEALEQFDSHLRSGLCTITNLAASDPPMDQCRPARKRRRSWDSSSGIAGTTRLSGIRRIHPQSSVTPSAQLLLTAHNRQQPRKAYENLDHHLQHEHAGLTKWYQAERSGQTSGKQFDARGTHDLSCKRGAGRSIRHHQLNDIIHRTLTRAACHPFWNRQDCRAPTEYDRMDWPSFHSNEERASHVMSPSPTPSPTHTFIEHRRRVVELQKTPPPGRRTNTLIFNKRTRSSHWRLKRLDPLTSKAWNFFKSWAAASQPSATTTVRHHSCSSESPSRCIDSMLSRSLTHLRKLLS